PQGAARFRRLEVRVARAVMAADVVLVALDRVLERADRRGEAAHAHVLAPKQERPQELSGLRLRLLPQHLQRRVRLADGPDLAAGAADDLRVQGVAPALFVLGQAVQVRALATTEQGHRPTPACFPGRRLPWPGAARGHPGGSPSGPR